MSENKRVIWLDYVRATACILVILLHVTAAYVKDSSSVNEFDWNFANIINSASRVCVPLFFMISGYIFFSDKSPKIKNFIRLLSALAFYSFVVIAMRLGVSIIKPDLVNSDGYYFFSAPSFYHLWFFYPLIIIYALAYFIKVRTDVFFRYTLLIITITFTALNSKLSDELTYLFGIDMRNYFMVDGDFIFFLLYAMCGAVLRQWNAITKKSSITLLLSFIICTLSISFLTWLSTNREGGYFALFHEYTSPLVFLSSLCIFSLFKSLNPKRSKIINFISDKSLPVYGFHAIFLYIIQKFFSYQNHSAIVFIPAVFLIVLLLSLSASMLLQKIDRKRYIS